MRLTLKVVFWRVLRRFLAARRLGAMPVGLSVMQRITLQHGAAPRAFLVVTLAASLVQDLINAGVVQAALSWAAP